VAVLVPLGAALGMAFLPAKSGRTVRWYALGVGLLDFAWLVTGLWQGYDPATQGYQLVEQWAWLPQLGWHWAVAVDGLSLPLLVLGALVTTLAIAAAWRVEHRPRLFYALMLMLYGAQLGVFAAKDVLLFFLMWELELVPVYLLIAIWGGPQRQYAATKFILYTALGSVLIVVGGVGLGVGGASLHLGYGGLAGTVVAPGAGDFCLSGIFGGFWREIAHVPAAYLVAFCPQ
jgi:NAD(P)H-quinone oxidoreductase subunit 4